MSESAFTGLILSESGLPGFKDVQDLINFLPDENKCNIPSFPIVGLNRLELLDREFIPWLLASNYELLKFH